MENVYDVKLKKKLEFIISDELYNEDELDVKLKNAAIIVYLYYIDTLGKYYKYLDGIPKSIDIYIVSPLKDVLEKVQFHIEEQKMCNVQFIQKPNRGRDISGLLIAAKEIVLTHEYVCFIHDKKAHSIENEKDTELWIENLWENTLKNEKYIKNIICKFKENDNIGVLVPPLPIGEHFCTWYGYAWHNSFLATKELATRLQLKTDVDESKPPITIGTVLWFKSKALEKLFIYPWKYTDFDDEQLKNSNYLSYGVERIFAYVAQDAGYLTGEIMTIDYAEKQNLFLQYSLTEIFRNMNSFFPFPTLKSVGNLEEQLTNLSNYVKDKKKILLYGAGERGRFCLGYLRKNGIVPEAFVVSSMTKEEQIIDNLSVIQFNNIRNIDEYSIIVTVADRKIQNEIIRLFLEKRVTDYFIVWK